MTRIAVTGGSGKLGRACVSDLADHGHDVVVLDVNPPGDPRAVFVHTDLTDYGETVQALSAIDWRYEKIDAVVHLAAIPGPTRAPGATIFRVNMLSTYNVFEASHRLGIQRVVWASSETLLGLPLDVPPSSVPLDETTSLPESTYALSKHLGEEMAEEYCRWDKTRTIVGLRFSNVLDTADYQRIPSFHDDAKLRKWNLWAYIDSRDGAQAIRKALEADLVGAHVFVIANDDTVMHRPNAELMAEIFPTVALPEAFARHRSLLTSEKARRVLGFQPQHGWRDQPR